MSSLYTGNDRKIFILSSEDTAIAISEARITAIQCGFPRNDQVLISTVVSELATNIIRYAGSGEIILRKIHDMGLDGIEVTAIDHGPGIINIELALQDNYSTTPNSLGLGLSSVKRIMDDFFIESAPGKGTTVRVKKWCMDTKDKGIDYYCSVKPMLGADNLCGDTGLVIIRDSIVYFGLIDAVGHGSAAFEAAVKAKEFLVQKSDNDLVCTIKELHEYMKMTVGLVLVLGRLDLSSGELSLSGIGNISVKIFGPHSSRFISRDGIVGYMMSSPKEQKTRLYSGDMLILTSDGVRENFDPIECAELFNKSAEAISKGLISRYGKKDDDASCLTIRLLL